MCISKRTLKTHNLIIVECSVPANLNFMHRETKSAKYSNCQRHFLIANYSNVGLF